MNKFYIKILSVLFVVGCSNNPKRETVHNLVLTPVKSFVLETEGEMFGKFRERFKLSDNGEYLIFSERIKELVYVFDKNGNFISTIGERGRGPKGIVRVSGFDIDEDLNIVILDLSQRLLKIFSLNNELKESSSLNLDAHGLGSTSIQIEAVNQKVFLQIVELEHLQNPGNSKVLALFNYDGSLDTLIGRFDPYEEEDNDYVMTHNFAIDPKDGLIVVSLQASPYITLYNMADYKELDYFGNASPLFKNPSKEVHNQLPLSEIEDRVTGSTVGRAIYYTDKFIIQHFQILTEEWMKEGNYDSKNNFLVIYDKQSRKFITEIPVPHTLGAVHNNKLYFIEDFNPDNYTIGIYEFVTEK